MNGQGQGQGQRQGHGHAQGRHHGHGNSHGHGHGHGHPERSAAEWIAVLDDPSRLAWQRPDDVVEALGLRGDELVVDVGAGSGTFTTRLARALPRGHVIATEVDPALLTHITQQARAQALPNVAPTLLTDGERGIPNNTDLVLLANVLHHLPKPADWLADLARTLRPKARVAILEFTMGDHPVGPPDGVKYSRQELQSMFNAAGLRVDTEPKGLLPYHHLIVLRIDHPAKG